MLVLPSVAEYFADLVERPHSNSISRNRTIQKKKKDSDTET